MTNRMTWASAMAFGILLLVAVGCSSEVAKHYDAGIEFGNQGLFEQAVTKFDEAIKLDPEHAGAYKMRGVAYSILGEFERALKLDETLLRHLIVLNEGPVGVVARASAEATSPGKDGGE